MAQQEQNRNRQRNPRRNDNRRDNRRNENRMPLDPLVLEALDFINLHADNSRVYKCFHKSKKTGTLETFGVYNSVTKKHAIFYTTNFFPQDFMEIKLVTLEKDS